MADTDDQVLDQTVEQPVETEAPVETDATEDVDTQTDGQEDDTDQADETQTDDEPADEAEQTEDETETAQGDNQEEKPDPKEQARQAYEQRQQQRAQRDYVNEQRQQIRNYQNDFQQKVRSGELDDLEQIKEQQRIIQANQYVDQVERSQNALVTEHSVAQAEIQLFNPKSDQWKNGGQRIYEHALQQFDRDYVVTDPDTHAVIGAMDRNGNPVSLLSYLRQTAAVYEDVFSTGQRQAQKAETRMRAKVVTPPSGGRVTSTNEDDDLFERIKDVPLNSIGS